jgi:hypothetical protein
VTPQPRRRQFTRTALSVLGSALAFCEPLPKLLSGSRVVEGVLNVRGMKHDDEPWQPMRAFVNRVEIFQCWYADTRAGIARTYDVFGDGKPHLLGENMPYSREGIEVLEGGLLSRTLYGKVEVRRIEG